MVGEEVILLYSVTVEIQILQFYCLLIFELLFRVQILHSPQLNWIIVTLEGKGVL